MGNVEDAAGRRGETLKPEPGTRRKWHRLRCTVSRDLNAGQFLDFSDPPTAQGHIRTNLNAGLAHCTLHLA